MQDDVFTCDLFRFLQLLCEGHNSGERYCRLAQVTRDFLSGSPDYCEPESVSPPPPPTSQYPESISSLFPSCFPQLYFESYVVCVLLLYQFSTSMLKDFQNYLRTQTGNNTTVNVIISTVDYLLRVQVSSPLQSSSGYIVTPLKLLLNRTIILLLTTCLCVYSRHRNQSVISTGTIRERTSLMNKDREISPRQLTSRNRSSIHSQSTYRYC